MNSENTNVIKSVLEKACGETVGADINWRSEGMERLYFDGPEGMGSVEIRHGQRNDEYVRIELQVSPDTAAKVIALVTNTTLGELPDMSATEPEQADAHTETTSGEKSAFPLPDLEIDARNRELAQLILQQRKDNDPEEEPSEDDPKELDFDLSE
jgi:hypothetical protein